jgi:hypothetical protein
MESENLHLVEWLRRIQLDWELDLEKLAKLSHTDGARLSELMGLSGSALEHLPSIPAGMENAAHLVGIYRRVKGVYPTPESQNEWLTRNNSVFEGLRPIDIMAMSPEHLAYVSYTVESGLRLGTSKE